MARYRGRKREIIRRRRMLLVAVAGTVCLIALLFGIRALFGGDEGKKPAANTPDASQSQPDMPQLGGDPTEVDRPWNLRLVSTASPMEEGYVPELTKVEHGNWSVDSRIAADLEAMLADCREDGLNPLVCSAFRPVEKQQELFDKQVERQKKNGLTDEEAFKKAAEVVAIPGTSEHHTGLALDIVSHEYQLLDEGQEDTALYRWMRDNCARFGFILRYPPESTDKTGIIYEPWHYRYVGKEAAEEIMSRGITLEEYLGKA